MSDLGKVVRVLELSQRARRLIGRLGARRSRVREGLVLVEGVKTVATVLDVGADLRFAVTSPKLEATDAGRALSARLEAEGLDVRKCSDGELDDLSRAETDQGVLLVVGEPEHDVGVVRRAGKYLVLDGVQDPGNVGVLVRAAAAFALEAVLVLEGTADVWGPKAVRASAGYVFALPTVRCTQPALLAQLGQAGVDLIVADADGQEVGTFSDASSFALAVGNESSGVRSELAAAALATLAVPMPGRAESLNVGMAGSILLYQLCRTHTRG